MNYTPQQIRQLRQEKDLPLVTVYEDRHIHASAVIPGVETLRIIPNLFHRGIVFKKEYLKLDAPPLLRGETPSREFNNVQRILKLVPNSNIPKAYGHTRMCFYGEYIEGREMGVASPFPSNIKDCLNSCTEPTQGWSAYLEQLAKLHHSIKRMQTAGILHEDLHTGNILATPNKLVLIDWGSASILPKSQRRQDPNYETLCRSDLIEIEREIILTMYHSDLPLPISPANLLNDLFPEQILQHITKHISPFDISV